MWRVMIGLSLCVGAGHHELQTSETVFLAIVGLSVMVWGCVAVNREENNGGL